MGGLQIRLLVIQPTPFCNIACKYCYLTTTSDPSRMTLQTVDQTLRRVFENRRLVGQQLNILWHSGEPLVMPPEFYRSAFRLLKVYAPDDIEVNMSIQTNATLITEEWAELFKENNIRVGVSIDGPERFHDSNRVQRDGMGTHAATLRGIKILTDAGVRFGLFPVITEEVVDHPEEMWEFFGQFPTKYIALNFEEIQAGNLNSSLKQMNMEERVRAFLRVFLALRDRYRPDIKIRECDEPQERLAEIKSIHRHLELIPLGIVNVAWNGDFSTFDPQLLGISHSNYGRFIFGNVHNNEFMDMLDNPLFKKVFTDIVLGLNKCKLKCAYYHICGGGSGSNKLFEHGTFDSSETLACRLRIKATSDIAVERLEGERGAITDCSREDRIRKWLDIAKLGAASG